MFLANSVQVLVQMSCTKTCNANELHALTKDFMDFIPSANELHIFVQLICIARFCTSFFCKFH